MKDLSAEEKIKNAAGEVFLMKGMDDARMQEIADKAGINKALLHYYYRNKEQLFQSVFEDKLVAFLPTIFQVFQNEQSIQDKVEELADRYIEFLKENPALPYFVLGELQRRPERLFERMNFSLVGNFEMIGSQLEKEAAAGNIRYTAPQHFVANLISMMVFPFIASPLLMKVFGYDQHTYSDYLDERKKEVPHFIMAALRP